MIIKIELPNDDSVGPKVIAFDSERQAGTEIKLTHNLTINACCTRSAKEIAEAVRQEIAKLNQRADIFGEC